MNNQKDESNDELREREDNSTDNEERVESKAKIAIDKLNVGKDETSSFTKEDIEKNKGMSILCYIGVLVVIPIFACKDSKFSRFHQNQGLILLITEFILAVLHSVLTSVFYSIASALGLIFTLIFIVLWLAVLIIAILGIINVTKGAAKRLPLIGKFNILKNK